MANLLTISKQQAIKPITQNNLEQFNKIAEEVENNELKKLLGLKFLQAIQADSSSYSSLLNETSFTDTDGIDITHKGIYYVLAYLNFSKYISQSDVVDTFTGLVIKSRQESESLPEGRIKRLQEDNRAIALTAWETIKYYLDLNYEDYPLWKSNNIKVFRPKIFGIKKTNYQ